MTHTNKYTTLVLPLVMYKETGSERKGTKREHFVVPTWNHIYKVYSNRIVLDKWAKLYKEEIVMLTKKWISINNWEKTVNKKVYVDMKIFFPDAIRRDAHNLDKLLLDAFEEAGIYDDDMNALLRFQDINIDVKNPRIEVEFKTGEYFDRKKEVDKQKRKIRKIKKKQK